MTTSTSLFRQIFYSHYIIIAGAMIISAGYFIKELSHTTILTEQFLFYRFSSMSLIYAVFMLLFRESFRFPQAPISLVKHYAIRSLLGFLGFLFFTLSLFLMPISASITLRYTGGLWTGLISYIMAKQYKKHSLQLLCLALSFLGVICIIRPSVHLSLLGIACGLLAGLSTGTAYFWVSLIGRYEKGMLRMVFYFGAYCTLFALILALCRGHLLIILFVPHEAIFPLFMVSILTSFAQIFLSMAFSRGYNMLTSTLLYSEILLAFAADALFMHQTISKLDILGTIIIIAGGLIQNWLVRKNHHQQPQTTHR